MNINTSKLPSKGFNSTASWILTSPMTYGEIIEYKRIMKDSNSDTINWFVSELLFWCKKYPDIFKISAYDSVAITLLVKFETIPMEREITLTFTDGSKKNYSVNKLNFIDMENKIKRITKVGEFSFRVPTIEELLKINYEGYEDSNFYDLLLAGYLKCKSVEELYKSNAKYSKVFDELKFKLIGLPYVKDEGGEEILIPLDCISSLFRDSIYSEPNSDVKVEYSTEE